MKPLCIEAAPVTIRKAVAPPGTDIFLQLDGQNSRGVRLEGGDLSRAKQRVVTRPGVAAEAVRVE
jgi:hypothetical protein